MAATALPAQTQEILHEFNGEQGSWANGVVIGPSGHLYGTMVKGGGLGNSGAGVVFDLTLTSGGVWADHLLHVFDLADGMWPNGYLYLDSGGNLFGTTQVGPKGSSTGGAYELSPTVGGLWHFALIHSFVDTEALFPEAGFTPDAEGNLYSTAYEGGAYGDGTVFELSPVAGGGWTETTLHSFNGADGANLMGNLIFDAQGNLYSTTQLGGAYNSGTVFELSPQVGSGWTLTTIYTFIGGEDGGQPYERGGLVFDSAGVLYGTTNVGGAFGKGTVFSLTPTDSGPWTVTVLHTFQGSDGSNPRTGLTIDASGNLYGEAFTGGSTNNGVVFEVSPAGDGTWTYKILHNFTGADGGNPTEGLALDSLGNLYGTAQFGGRYGDGSAYFIKP